MDKAEEKFESQRFFCPADYFACFYCKHEFNGDLREWDPHCENEKFIEKYAGELNEYEKDYGGKKLEYKHGLGGLFAGCEFFEWNGLPVYEVVYNNLENRVPGSQLLKVEEDITCPWTRNEINKLYSYGDGKGFNRKDFSFEEMKKRFEEYKREKIREIMKEVDKDDR